mgnify:CR=1 FL=1
MAEKNKKISVNELERYFKETSKRVTTQDWQSKELVIKNYLSLKEMLQFVDSVVKSCFSEDGEYLPEIKEFAINKSMIEIYSNFRLPDDVNLCYDILYGTDIVNTVYEVVGGNQFDEIVTAIDTKIANILKTKESLISKQFNELYNSMSNITKSFEEKFTDVDSGTIANLNKAIAGNRIDEKKFIEAYFEARKINDSNQNQDSGNG